MRAYPPCTKQMQLPTFLCLFSSQMFINFFVPSLLLSTIVNGISINLHLLVAAVPLPLQVHLSDGHPGEEREVVLQSADGGHRGADAHRVHAHRGPGLHAVWTHLQETQVRALRSPIATGSNEACFKWRRITWLRYWGSVLGPVKRLEALPYAGAT